jgi:hypothetical protein
MATTLARGTDSAGRPPAHIGRNGWFGARAGGGSAHRGLGDVLLAGRRGGHQRRSDEATQHKLNAVSAALANLMESLSTEHPAAPALKRDLEELREAVGLENRESA